MAPPTPWSIRTPPAGIVTRSLHDALPICRKTLHASYLHLHWAGHPELAQRFANAVHDHAHTGAPPPCTPAGGRSEEHTSALQSRLHLVCRRLLERTNPVRRPAAAVSPAPV